MKKTILTLAMIAAMMQANAQEIDSTKTVKDKVITQTEQTKDNFNGNVELILGLPDSPYNTYVRPNIFYNIPGKNNRLNISGYDWTEVYTDGTICGRNTLSKPIISIGKADKPKAVIGLENQLIYITGVPVSTGVGVDVTFKPTKNVEIKPYFTPFMFTSEGKIEENRSITGVYFSAKITPKLTVSGFGEMNFSAKIDQNDNGTTKDDKPKPEWSYGEVSVAYSPTAHSTIEYVPSLTRKDPGVAAPKVNHRIGYIYTF